MSVQRKTPEGPVPEEPARDEALAGSIDLDIFEAMQPAQKLPAPNTLKSIHCRPGQLDNRTFLFGTWHKTGTNLFRQTARLFNGVVGIERCFRGGCTANPPHTGKRFDSQGRLDSKHWPAPSERTIFVGQHGDVYIKSVDQLSGGEWRGVVCVRDPVGMLVSSYVYHMRGRDCGKCDCKRMKKMGMLEGLKMQAKCNELNVQSMMRAYRSAKANGNARVVTFESLVASSSSFDDAMGAAYAHLTSGCGTVEAQNEFVAKVSGLDLHRNPNPPGRDVGGPHISSKEEIRKVLATVMDNNLDSPYRQIRAEMSYV